MRETHGSRDHSPPCSADRGDRVGDPHAVNDQIEIYNPQATPFEWTEESVHRVGLQHRYADLRN